MKNYEKLIIIFCIFFIEYSLCAQIGIGVELPREMLDVNGPMRIRNTNYLKDVNAKPLYRNSDGVLGIRNIKGAQQLVFAAEGVDSKLSSNSVIMFNSGKRIILPIKESDIVMNTMEMTKSNNYLKIKDDGQYLYNASINLNTVVADLAKDYAVVNVEMECSSNNGLDWKLVTSNSYTLLRGTFYNKYYVSRIITLLIPPFIYEHKAGDLLRMSVIRSRDESTQVLQGSVVSFFDVSTEGGLRAYNIIINKL